jgi:hypothetical protein
MLSFYMSARSPFEFSPAPTFPRFAPGLISICIYSFLSCLLLATLLFPAASALTFQRVRISLKIQGKGLFITRSFSITYALFCTLFLEVLCYQSVPQFNGGIPQSLPSAATDDHESAKSTAIHWFSQRRNCFGRPTVVSVTLGWPLRTTSNARGGITWRRLQ